MYDGRQKENGIRPFQELTKTQVMAAKGILAIMVVVHHLYSVVCGTAGSYSIYLMFNSLGYLAVSAFFFLSGQGLAIQYRNDRSYIDKFLRHRVIPLYVDYVALIVLYTAIKLLIVPQEVKAVILVQSFIGGGYNS